MVVAARATDGDAKQARPHDVGHFGEHFTPRAGDILIAGILAERAQPIEAAGDQVRLVAHLRDRELPEADLLLVGEGRSLPGGPREHQPVRAVVEQVAHEADGGRLVETPVRVEGCDHRREYASDGHVAPSLPRGWAVQVSRPRWRARHNSS